MEDQLTGRGYRFAYFDGLNRYYVHETHAELAGKFTTPPNYFDHFELSETSPFVQNLRRDILLARDELTARESEWQTKAEALDEALRLQAQSFATDLKAVHAERDETQLALQNAQRAKLKRPKPARATRSPASKTCAANWRRSARTCTRHTRTRRACKAGWTANGPGLQP